jgi:hypothetical protein
MHWPTPEFADEIRPDSGPVMITIEYRVPKENKTEFLRLSRQLKLLRKRDGAFSGRFLIRSVLQIAW